MLRVQSDRVENLDRVGLLITSSATVSSEISLKSEGSSEGVLACITILSITKIDTTEVTIVEGNKGREGTGSLLIDTAAA